MPLVHCWERMTSRAVPEPQKKTSGNECDGRTFGTGGMMLSTSFGQHEKLVPCGSMSPEEKPQHDQPGQEVGQDQGPPGQDFEEPLGEDRDQPQREYLEAAKQHDHDEDQAGVSIRCGQEAGRHEPEGHKGHPVEHGVLENQPDRDVQRSRISEPLEDCRAQQGGRPKGLSHRRIYAKEPNGYCNGADRASNHSLDNRVFLHRVVSLRRHVGDC